ncbi:MAG: HEAT repeat domain-containing protein, partial [Planctomycetota bacterium]
AVDGSRLWQWWWEHNKDRYLARAAERGRINPGSAYYWFGAGAKYPPREIVPVSESQRDSTVLTTLRAGLRDRDASVRCEACIALGRVGSIPVAAKDKQKGQPDDLVARELIAVLEKEPTTTPQNREVRRSACLAIGISGNADACDYLLRTFAKATPDGRANRVIAFGLARHAPAIATLVEMLPKASREKPTEEQLAAVHALGLYGPSIVPELEKSGALRTLEKLANPNLAEDTAIQAVTALGRLQQGLKEVKHAYQSGKSLDLRWAAVLAMAFYAHDEKDASEAAKTLTTKCYKDGEGQTKNFSVLACGDLAWRLDPNSRVRESLLKHLREAIDVKDNYVRSCASVALGLAGDATSVAAIAGLLEDASASDYTVAAACLALGLLRSTEHAELVKNAVLLKPKWNADARGYAALGLALMGDTTRIDELREFHARRDLNDKTLRQTPLAIGVLGGKSEVKLLVEGFSKGWKQNDRHAASNAAFGLGWMRDESAVGELSNLATKSGERAVRGMAIVALGYCAARDKVTPLSRCIENASFRNKFNHWELLEYIGAIL